jgi:hypothetical protein
MSKYYPAVDPLGFLVDDEIRPFEIDKRQDLTGTGAQACPIQATGLFIVHEHKVPENTAEVIHDVFPHVWRRTNPGAADESVAMIPAIELAGFVLFDSTKANNQPFLVENDYNVPTVAATPNNLNREVVRGTTFLADDAPIMNNVGMRNPLRTIYLPAGSIFRVIFRLVPLTATAAIPNPFTIGANPVVGGKRLDFAGARVSGVRMPQQMYEDLKIARRKGELGPEGSSAQNPIGVSRGSGR